MKIRKLLFPTLAIAVAGTSVYFSSTNEEKPAYTPRESKMKVRHTPDWNGAAEYYTSLRKNINTGKVEIDDVLRSREQVKIHSMQKSGSLNLVWKERGPDNIGGRTRAIVVDKNNSNHVFAGSVSGGLFVSNNAGSTWSPVNDQFENLIVASLTQAPDGSFWMGTGSDFDYSANQEGILFPGNGLFKSTNGGTSWTRIVGQTLPNNVYDTLPDTTGVTKEWSSINRIAFKPGNNSDEIYCAMNKGLRVSDDGGQTWTNPIYLNMNTCAGTPSTLRGEDLDVTSDGRLFVSIDGQIYYSDTPKVCSTYVKVTAVPKGKRTEIAISPSNPNYVYACLVASTGHFQAVYKSTDKGVTWAQILFPIPNYFTPMSNDPAYGQGVYDLAFAVAPNDPNTIFIGGVQLWRYDGNLTRIADEFSNFPPYYVHADKHIITFDPNNPYLMYIGCDGGVFKSFDQGNNFFSANKGYNVTHFYAGAHNNPPDKTTPTILLAGSQDNGTNMMKGTGASPLASIQVRGGDGFDCDISSITGAMFGTIYYNDVARSSAVGGSFASFPGQYFTENIFHTVIRLWESSNDMTSRAQIVFKVDTTKQAIGTGNGTKKQFTGNLAPLQLSAKLVIGSLRILAGGVNFNDWVNTGNTNSTFGTGNTCSINYSTGAFTVTFLNAPTVNTPVWAYYTTHYDAGAQLTLGSNTEGVPVPHTISQSMDYGDSIVVQDPTQAMLAMGVESSKTGVVINRKALRFDEAVDTTWIRVGPSAGIPSCIEFSPDGDCMFVGIDNQGVYRICGLNDVYDSVDAVTPGVLTKTKIFAKSVSITGIAVDWDNPNNVVVTTGNYGITAHVYLTTQALTATATSGNGTFADVTGNLPYMPVYDPEFINHSSTVVLGTEFGVYATTDIFAGSVNWTDENNGVFPHMPVFEVRQQKFWPSNNYEMLFITTHGRGMWESGSLVTGINEPPKDGSKTRFLSDLSVYPNPVNGEGGILTFNLKSASSGNIRIYDLNGRNVKSWVKQPLGSGMNRIKLDTGNLSEGTYFVTVETVEISSVAKFIVIK